MEEKKHTKRRIILMKPSVTEFSVLLDQPKDDCCGTDCGDGGATSPNPQGKLPATEIARERIAVSEVVSSRVAGNTGGGR